MPAAAANGSLYLVDAHSLIFQVFHALPEMTSPSGLPTNALFGFTKDMMFLRTEKKPDYLVCAFDMPGKTFRDQISPEYKAHRAPMPDDLSLQIPLIHQMLQAYDTLENVLAHVDEIPGAKRQENLRAAGPIVEQSRPLVKLATDVPLQLDWEDWKVHEWDAPRLSALFREWGFHRFADQVR